MKASANGYILEINGYEIAAAWTAPYFVLCLDDPEAPNYCSDPLLIHCEDAAHALRCRGNFFRTIPLGPSFDPIDWNSLAEEPPVKELRAAA